MSDYILSEDLLAKIQKNLANYPSDQKQSSILFALTETQNSNGGWLGDKHLKAIAKILEIEPIKVYEVATFYSMIKLKPQGKHLLSMCTNISCKLNGAYELVKFIEEYLDIKIGQTTEDNLFTFEQAECLAACTNAPMIL